jgi:hypothetical protein
MLIDRWYDALTYLSSKSQNGISRLLAHSRLNAEGELSDPNDAVRAEARTQAKLLQKALLTRC